MCCGLPVFLTRCATNGLVCRLVTVFCLLGYYPCYSPGVLLPYLLAVSLAATVVEALPINKVCVCVCVVHASPVAHSLAMIHCHHQRTLCVDVCVCVCVCVCDTGPR